MELSAYGHPTSLTDEKWDATTPNVDDDLKQHIFSESVNESIILGESLAVIYKNMTRNSHPSIYPNSYKQNYTRISIMHLLLNNNFNDRIQMMQNACILKSLFSVIEVSYKRVYATQFNLYEFM